MIPPKQWRPFKDDGEALAAMKSWGLLPSGASITKQVTYAGFYTDTPVLCDIAGTVSASVVVLRIGSELHCINIDHLKDMQGKDSRAAADDNITAKQLTTKQALALRDYVAFDLETTGFVSATDHIIEIGAVKVIGGIEADSFSALVNPGIHLSSRITKLTGITDSDLASAPPLWSVAGNFLNFISGFPLIAHNATFDIGFFCRHFSAYTGKEEIRFCDTLALARQFFPNAPDHKLDTLVEYLQLPDCAHRHRAADDARCVARLYEEIKLKARK